MNQSRIHNKVNEIDTNDIHGDTRGDSITATPAADNWIDPKFDAAGNMISGPKPGDEVATGHTYTYDAWNRLVKVQQWSWTDAEPTNGIYDDDWSAVVAWASSKANEILYCGYRFDPETRLYHVRMRPYHPTLGRWTSREPGGVYRDGMNLYQYVRSNPINGLDPSGLRKISVGPWELDVPVPTICYTYSIDVTTFQVQNWKRQIVDDESGMGKVTQQKTEESVQDELNAMHAKGELPITGKKECPKGCQCKILMSVKKFAWWKSEHRKYWIDIGWKRDGSDTVSAPDWWWKDADVMVEFDLRLRADIDADVGICVN